MKVDPATTMGHSGEAPGEAQVISALIETPIIEEITEELLEPNAKWLQKPLFVGRAEAAKITCRGFGVSGYVSRFLRTDGGCPQAQKRSFDDIQPVPCHAD